MSTLGPTLNRRTLPGRQEEQVPTVDELAAHLAIQQDEAELSSSLRSNFLPRGVPFIEPDVMLSNFACSPSSSESPVFRHFVTLDRTKLRCAEDESSQRLRRRLLRGAHLLIIQGGYHGKKFIYEKLRELGVLVTIMDGPDSLWRASVDDGLIESFIALDFSEYETIFERALDAVLAQDISFDAVTTYYEDAVPLAARLAVALGLETNSIAACDRARSKHSTREAMQSAGLPTPRFYKLRSEADVALACEHVGFPAILKPSFGAASMGVCKVASLESALQVYRKVLSSLCVEHDTIWAQGTELVMEEYLDGDEFDVDVLLFEGQPVYAKVSDNWACREPSFQEVGTNCPSLYPAEKQQELATLAVDSLKALGFTYGAFHAELKYTHRGARLIEINARMSGVSVYDCHRLAWGVDLVEQHAMAVLKIPIRPKVPSQPLGYFGEVALNAPFSGAICSDTWLDHLLEDKRIVSVHYFLRKGDRAVGPEDGTPHCIGEIRVFVTESGAAMCDFVQRTVRSLKSVPIDRACNSSVLDESANDECEFYFPSDHHPFSQTLGEA